MKEHPDGDGIGEAARQGAGDDKNQGGDQLVHNVTSTLNVVHEPPCFEGLSAKDDRIGHLEKAVDRKDRSLSLRCPEFHAGVGERDLQISVGRSN